MIRFDDNVTNVSDDCFFSDKQIRWRHRHVVPVMATGIAQLRKELEQSREYDWDNVPEIHQFLDGFYLSRIGIRMLIGQHVALHKPNPAKNHVGLVCTKLKPKEIAEDAIADARDVCIRNFGRYAASCDCMTLRVYSHTEFVALFSLPKQCAGSTHVWRLRFDFCVRSRAPTPNAL